MNVPNRLTILRVIMIPLFVVAMLWESLPYSDYIALVLFAGACITDFFDGYLARKYNQITDLLFGRCESGNAGLGSHYYYQQRIYY